MTTDRLGIEILNVHHIEVRLINRRDTKFKSVYFTSSMS